RQLAASAGELDASAREAALREIVARSGDDPVVADLVVSALAGREMAFLERLLTVGTTDAVRTTPVTRALTRAIVASRDSASVQRVLVLASEARRPRWQRLALLEGAARPAGQRGGFVVLLSSRPAGLLAATTSPDTALRARAMQVAQSLAWPGKRDAVPAVRPFTPVERARYATGRQQYLTTCAACHQTGGTGLAGVAKPLVGSQWVLGRPERLIRILLHGKEGTMLMPPIGAALSNDQLAAVLTYVRRSWGNSASALDAAAVEEVRGATTGRKKPWTEEELQRIGR
ncbi:MAG: cytochrome c, partial [Polaromonas sp.]|nr:cytochrome c [Gemmatimonadaceae bacterium]